MAANLSGASSLGCELLSAPQNSSPTPSRNTGLKNCACVCIYIHIESTVCCRIKQFLKMYSIFDYHNATVAEFKAWIVQLQICTETTSTPPFRGRDTGEETDSRAVLVHYWGTSVIKHPFTSEGSYFLPAPVIVAFRAHKNMQKHNSWMQQSDLKCLQFIHKRLLNVNAQYGARLAHGS